ncbi:rab11 family-interacting protein 5-like isoform X3 [Lucilia sericata]|uniref:rab11 family-interacting protein 5-like isoform X3 n=1 Tax=Lucilia sericata TaxID=13632 RepID=UPI0018A80330|nr:rab11 family-interacting protein 5-like isoform X3 [Lucilia sericata]
MWSPTHIKVTINSARNLLCKGKNNTNNCFVTIGLGKEKYQTSVKEKAESKVEWKEECELKIPDQGNRAELVLTCLHRNNLGIDEFLGQVTLPLNEMDAYVRSKAKWYKLESKPGKEKKNKERGELEVEISFTVKSGSLTDLSKKEKHKSSIGQLASSVGGSLLSISTIEKRKGIKKIAKKFGSKLHLSGSGKKKNKDDDDMSYTGSFASIGTPNRVRVPDSDDEDEFQFDKLSQKSSVSSLNMRDGLQPPSQNYTPRNPSPLMGSTGKGQIEKQTISNASTPSPKQNERIIIGHEKATTQAERRAEISAALAKKYEGKSREELMLIANGMENEALIQRQRVKELEDYLDNLLLRVMETHPKILQNPYSRTTSAKSFKNYINMNDFL